MVALSEQLHHNGALAGLQRKGYGRGNISGQRTVPENFTKPPASPVVEHTIKESLVGFWRNRKKRRYFRLI